MIYVITCYFRPEDLEDTEEEDAVAITEEPAGNGDSTAIPMPEA